VRRLIGSEGKVGKKVQELTADLGVVGIVEGKLGGGSSTRNKAGAVRFRGRRWCFGNWSEGEGKLIRELRCGDVVLMVLLAKEEKGWNFGSTRIRTAAESEIAGATFWVARAQEEEKEWVWKGQ
jgi:hypothetical protein